MAIWPFTRAKLAGYTDTVDVPTAAELNKIDTQAAQAADGVTWTDVVIAKNWLHNSGVLANRGDALAWSGAQWVSIGRGPTLSTTPECSVSYDGKLWASIGVMGAGVGLSAVNCAASNGAGVVLAGGTPSSGSVQKIRRSADHGATWTIPNSVDATAAGVVALAWFPAGNVFVAALSNTNIETSPDGVTWTSRTVPNVAGGFAVSPTAIICGRNRSTDGITWTSLSAQLTTDYFAFAYSTALQKFFAFGWTGSASVVKSSSDDGLTWSAAGLVAPVRVAGTIETVPSYGRVLLVTTAAGPILYSIDGALSWRTTKIPDSSSACSKQPVLGSTQFLTVDNNKVHYGTLAAGS